MFRLDIIVFLVGSILLFKILKAFTCSGLKHVPGPWYTIITNLPLKLSVLSGQKMYYIDYLHQQYGKVVRISPDTVAVADLESTLKIHKIGSGFTKTKWYSDVTPNDRDGIFAVRDAKEHAMKRKLFSRAFSKTSLRTHWEKAVVEKVRLAFIGIQREVQDSGEADILKWFTFLATDLSGLLMFGESFNMLEKGRKDDYIAVLEKAVMGNALRAELPLVVPILKLLPFKAIQDTFNGNDLVCKYAEKAVENAKTAGYNTNVFAHMIRESTSDTGTLDDLDVLYEAGNFTVAGSDTTAVSLTYLIWAVLQEPQLRKALLKEVESLPSGFNDASLEALPLLNATIEEGLRLYGAAPGDLPRYVPSSGTTLAGVFLPGNSTVTTQSWTMHRDPQLFQNPKAFDPYRFLPNRADSSTLPHSTATKPALNPFGHGARICLGIHLVYMELRYALAYFLLECQCIELSSTTTVKSMEPVNFFLISPKSHKCMVRSGKK